VNTPGSSEPTIREADVADVEELARLRWQMTNEEGDVLESLEALRPRLSEAFARFAASRSWAAFVADDRSASAGLVGCLWLKRIERVPRPNRDAVVMGYVTNVYVEPTVRNQGIGTRLLAAARELAEREQLAELFVWPSDDAVSLYRRAGYAPSRELHELELVPDL
jgi:GNAT superfamily N-acetyltransferase